VLVTECAGILVCDTVSVYGA